MKREQLNKFLLMYERRLKEMTPIVYSAFAIAMKRQMGAEYDDILAVLAETQYLWEQANDGNIDILRLCSEETGVNIITGATAMENDIEGEEI